MKISILTLDLPYTLKTSMLSKQEDGIMLGGSFISSQDAGLRIFEGQRNQVKNTNPAKRLMLLFQTYLKSTSRLIVLRLGNLHQYFGRAFHDSLGKKALDTFVNLPDAGYRYMSMTHYLHAGRAYRKFLKTFKSKTSKKTVHNRIGKREYFTFHRYNDLSG